jgi:hypothetical protein
MVETKVAGPELQYVTEHWNGSTSIAMIPNSGTMSKITTISHDLTNLGHGLMDVGGPMILNRESRNYMPGICVSGPGKGSQVNLRPSVTGPSASEPHNSDLYGFGGTAIARTLPTNPAFDATGELSQFFGELGALPKALGASLWRERMLNAKSLSGELLNFEFAWQPLLQDILDVCQAAVDSHKILKKYHDGSGHHTRKGFRFPHEPSYSTPVVRGSSAYSVNPSNVSWKVGQIWYQTSSDDEIWFSGCYYYHLPVTADQMSRSQRFAEYADKVLGINKPSLEDVWNMSPWSWAVDWAANTGDVARNISAFADDSLLLHYGYIMCHRWTRESWWSVANAAANTTACRLEHLSEWKVRFPASPYGFGLTYDGLSSVQKAILAAVGIARFT